MRTANSLAAVLAALLWGASAHAAPLTEAQAVDTALQRHPSIDAARSALVAARGIAEEARFVLPENPQLGLEYETDALNGNAGERQWSVSLSTPIWIAGQRSARQAFATERLREATLDVEATRWLLAGAVRAAYWRVWQAQALWQAASQRASRTAELAGLAERQVKAREAAPIEASQVRAEALADRQLATKAEGAYWSALAAFAELIGEPATELEAPQPAAPPSAMAVQVLEQRPDLQALRQRIRAAQVNLDLQDRLGWPNPEVGLGLNRKRDAFASGWDNTVTIGVSVPIPVFERNQRERAAASADQSRAQAEYRQGLRQAQREARQAESDWQSAWERWQQARQAVALADDSLRLAERSYRIGELSAADLIQEKRRWADLVAAEREAIGDMALARAAWRQAAGEAGGE